MRSLLLAAGAAVLLALSPAPPPALAHVDHVHADPVAAEVVASKNSDVYHRTSCRHARRILPENRVRFESEAAARESGRRPCRVCRPAR